MLLIEQARQSLTTADFVRLRGLVVHSHVPAEYGEDVDPTSESLWGFSYSAAGEALLSSNQ